MKLSRRRFTQLALTAPGLFALRPAQSTASEKAPARLSFRAYDTTAWEGEKLLGEVEGELPRALDGAFFKIGPGTKDIFGTPLNHFFDGDAYVTKLAFSDGEARLSARFLKTPARTREQESGEMAFHEFGTAVPRRGKFERKNQPNINVLPWGASLLALSEGGHPAAFDPESLEFQGFHDFEGSLPKNVSFAAHPKVDPRTGVAYAFGIHQSLSRALKVFRLNPATKKVEELYSLKQKHVHMIHDMAQTRDHLVFLIPPAYFKLSQLVLGREPLSEAIEFDPKLGARLLVLDKTGEAQPIEVPLPGYLTFHHACARLDGDTLTLHTCLARDASLLDLINQWQAPTPPKATLPDLCEVVVDLKTKTLVRVTPKLVAHDFPVFDQRRSGEACRYVYAAGMRRSDDPMAFDRVTKLDLETGSVKERLMPAQRVCGEPVYIPKPGGSAEDEAWIGFLGFDGERGESFFEVLEAQSLGFVARVWLGEFVPVGFHGHFITK